MKMNLKWILFAIIISLILVIIYYLKPKLIEGHKINNEWHKTLEKDSDGILHYHPYTWSINQENTGVNTTPLTGSDIDWQAQTLADGYNCFIETQAEKECRELGINCPEDPPNINCDSESDPTCNIESKDSEDSENLNTGTTSTTSDNINVNTYSYGTQKSVDYIDDVNTDTYSYGSIIGFKNLFSKKISEAFTNEKQINFDKLTPILKNTTPVKLYNYNKFNNLYTFVTYDDNDKYLFDNKLDTSAQFKSISLENYTVIANNEKQNTITPNNQDDINIKVNIDTPQAINAIEKLDSTIGATKVESTSDVITSDVITSDVITSDVITSDVITSDVITNNVITNDVITNDVKLSSITSDTTSDIASDIIQNLQQIDKTNNQLPNGIVFGPLHDILKPRCSSNEDSPAITISLTCGKKPEDAPTRFILYGIANWNGSENGLSKFIKLIQVDDIIFSEPFQESSYVFENKSCFLTSYHITFFHNDGPKLITLNNIQLYYQTDNCICCLGC